jgi:hypothetical protein
MKRILLALTFVAVLGAAGLGMSSNAAAWHGCNDGYGYGGYGYRSYPSYYGGWGQSRHYGGYHSRRDYHGDWHGHRGHHHGHHDHGGISFSFGF